MTELRGNMNEYEENRMISLVSLKGEYDKEKWRSQANCRGRGNDGFFIEHRGGASAYFEARCVCYGCPVKKDCLEFAIENSIKDGMWGGLTYRERLKYARGERRHAINIFDLIRGLRGPKQTIRELAKRLGVTEDDIRREVRKGYRS